MRGRDKAPPIPIEVRILTKAVARHQAQKEGREAPPYTQEELEEMRRDDLETVAGEGFEAQMRENAGWQTEEGQALLDAWEEDAHRRLDAAEGLPPEEWHLVWGVDDEEEDEPDRSITHEP
jgi:hypothetical protein